MPEPEPASLPSSAENGRPEESRASLREALAQALAQGMNIEQAVKHTGVPPRTAYNWRKKESFKARMRAIRAEMYNAGTGILASANQAAAAKLATLLNDPDTKVALGAATKLLDLSRKLRETEDLVAEIEKVKRAVHKANAARTGGDPEQPPVEEPPAPDVVSLPAS